MRKKLLVLISFVLVWGLAGSASAYDLTVPVGQTHIIISDQTYDRIEIYGTMMLLSGDVTVADRSVVDGGEIIVSGGTLTVLSSAERFDVGQGNGGAITMNGGLFRVNGSLKLPDDDGGITVVTLNGGILSAQETQVYLDRNYHCVAGGGVFRIDGDVEGAGEDDPRVWLAQGALLPAGGYDEIIIEYVLAGDYTEVRALWVDPNLASEPSPFDGVENVDPDVVLNWTPGISATAHDVYLGVDFDDVNEASNPYVTPGRGRQEPNSYAPPGLLELDQIYYWRIDEVTTLDTLKGRVWRFKINDGKASNPSPTDGVKVVSPDAVLSWTPGIAAASHDVYLGTNFNDVNDATTTVTLDVYKGNQSLDANTYDPCGLELGTNYYWRVDEVNGLDMWKGNVWSFKTALVSIVGNVVVFGGPEAFGGWPANAGVWTWGGKEILVGFERGTYLEQDGHNIDDDKPKYQVLARSTDGGETWMMEDPENFVDDGGEVTDPPGNINFAHPDFAMRVVSYTDRGEFLFSYDRGRNWQGPYTFGNLMDNFNLVGLENSSRTDYIVEGPNKCLIGMSARIPGSGLADRAFCARTTDGGATFNFVSWINPEPVGTTRGVMPSMVRISETKLVAALRRKYPGNWIDVFVSNNNGSSWSFLSKVADTDLGGNNGNPPSMVRLKDGRLCVTYAYRDVPYGIRAKISDDEGQTWSEEITLRDDGREWDLGYTRTVMREDGRLVTIYYYTTLERWPNYIAATIWGEQQPLDRAWDATPHDGAIDVPPDVVLSWTPGISAASHNVYFGSGLDDVNDADTSSSEYKGSQALDANTYDPCGLQLGKTYHWRIDEVNGANTWEGNIWRLTVSNYVIVDDMESYNDTTNLIYDTWLAGSDNQTGSVLELLYNDHTYWLDPPAPVRGGKGSMKFQYDNSFNYGAGYYSEIDADTAGLNSLGTGRDWTVRGIKALALYFYGDPNNDADATEQMYVALEDGSGSVAVVPYDGDADDVKIADWQEWNINLQDFGDGGVDLEDVNKVHIGFGDRDNPVVPGGSGVVCFDNVRLYPNRCVPAYGPVGDVTGDCIVNFMDIDIMARDWLNGDYTIFPVAPDSGGLKVHYEFEETSGSTAYDSTANNYHAVAKVENGSTTEAFWETGGKYGRCIRFENYAKDYCLEVPNATFGDITEAITISVWVNWDDPATMPEEHNQIFSMHGGPGVEYEGILGIETGWPDGDLAFWDASTEAFYPAEEQDWWGAWNHYGFVKDVNEGYLRIYLNSDLVAEAGSNQEIRSPVDLARVGHATDFWHDEYTGFLDDFRIYNYALSQAEVMSLAGTGEIYFPLDSPVNLYDEEATNFKKVNFRDYAVIVNSWLDEKWFPEGP